MGVFGRGMSSFRIYCLSKALFYNSKTRGERLKQISDTKSTSKNK